MSKKQRAIQVFKGIMLLGIFGGIYLFVFLNFNIGIPCIFNKLTGRLCPGCGMTRALSSLWKGEIAQAIAYNALSITVFPILCLYLLYRAYRYIIGKGEGFYWWEYILLVLLFAATMGYCVWHNMILL